MSMVGLFIGGLVALVAGAQLLVRGASRIATRLGISALVVGLTVVAYGTGAPELAVSTQAGLAGNSAIAVGNVVGSNIFNILFILGLSALIVPLAVAQQLVRREVPLLIGISALVLAMAYNGRLSLLDGVLLVMGLIAYTVFAIWQSRRETQALRAEYAQEYGGAVREHRMWLVWQVALVVTGLALLILGARWLVAAAIEMARLFGISELVIGLTIVAAGTSMPEVATSIVAAVRGERDIAVGNVIGSNIFNILGILGIATLVTPGGLTVAPALVSFDMPVMLAVAVACLPLFFTGNMIARWEGALFFAYYVAYTTYLILAAQQHDALPAFSAVMLLLVLPLTAITLLVLVVRALRGRQRAHEQS
jgi:cation:H+ antiporter